jgi:hypothetical protein
MTRIRGDALDGDDRAAESTRLQAETGVSMLKGMPPPPICLRCAHTCSSSLCVCTSRCTKGTKHSMITPSSCFPLDILIESQANVLRLFVMCQPLFVQLNGDHSHSQHAAPLSLRLIRFPLTPSDTSTMLARNRSASAARAQRERVTPAEVNACVGRRRGGPA